MIKPSTSRASLLSLIESVGGEGRVEELLILFYRKMAADVMLGFFFQGRDPDSVAKGQATFIFHAAGIRPGPSPRSPARAHSSLPPILKGHFDRRLRLLEEVLREAGLEEPTIQAWVGFEESFRRVVEHEEPKT